MFDSLYQRNEELEARYKAAMAELTGAKEFEEEVQGLERSI